MARVLWTMRQCSRSIAARICQDGHAVGSLQEAIALGVGLGAITAWQNCDESRRERRTSC
jgi:hypothetical protein